MRIPGIKAWLMVICINVATTVIYAQDVITIGVISDLTTRDIYDNALDQMIKDEILLLTENRFEIEFRNIITPLSLSAINGEIESALKDPEIDMIITVGAIGSSILATREEFPKPAIASIILDAELQRTSITEETTSGVNNFTYVQTPFDANRDIKKLHEIKPFKKLGILGEDFLGGSFDFFSSIFEKAVVDLDVELEYIEAKPDVQFTIDAIPDDVEAIYILPLFTFDDPLYLRDVLEGINSRKISTSSMLGENFIEAGVLMAYESDANIKRLPRRIALNVMKIIEGSNASDLSVTMPTYQENLLINFKTAHETGIYPNWDIMTSAIVVNFDEAHVDRQLTLSGTIAEALQSNLALQITQSDIDISAKDVAIAQSELYPQLDVSTSVSQIDPNSAQAAFGNRGQTNLMAGGTISQIIFSEPAQANIAINRFLQKGKEYAFQSEQFDLILEIVNAYLGVLQAKSFLTIQGENVRVTRENYDISKAKEVVGYSGASDLNRWESELALKNIDFNDAIAQLQQAKFNLNRILNRPIDEAFDVEDIGRNDVPLLATDSRLQNIVNNHGDMHVMADFLVVEALDRLPLLKELNTGISVQQRLLQSSQRALYLPSAILTAQLDHILQKWNLPDNVVPVDNKAQWSIGLGVQYPIFQGRSRKAAIERDQIGLEQIKQQYMDTERAMELSVRAAMENAIASYRRLDLSFEAAAAARRNFDILQDSYNQGLVNITALIDAQNSSVLTDLTAVNSEYTFIADFIALERAIGFYFFLASEEQRSEFINKLIDYMTTKKE